MLSIDTNILLYAMDRHSSRQPSARNWLYEIERISEEVVISEFVLTELYCLLRNPSVIQNAPLSAPEAVNVINIWRNHPRWRLVGFPVTNRALHDKLWKIAAKDDFAFRRIYDVRLALTLQDHGVTEFATCNVKDFLGLGFARVWNPLAPP